MLVSCIVTTFNRSERVTRAVESVLAQTYPHHEVIVVDDGSTDTTPEALARFGDRIRAIRQANRGPGAARNTGVAASRGEIIAFLDSDDLWLPEKLEAQVALFRTNPDCRINQTEEIWIRRGRRVNPRAYHAQPDGEAFRASLSRCVISPSAVAMRRSLWDEVGGFDERLPACEDYDLWLRITWRWPVPLIRKPLVVKHGGHADQLSHTIPALDRFRIFALLKLLAETPLSGEQRCMAEAELRRRCAIYSLGCRRRGREQEAVMIETLPIRNPLEALSDASVSYHLLKANLDYHLYPIQN